MRKEAIKLGNLVNGRVYYDLRHAIYWPKGCAPALTAAMGMGGGFVPLLAVIRPLCQNTLTPSPNAAPRRANEYAASTRTTKACPIRLARHTGSAEAGLVTVSPLSTRTIT